jgi:hypothetical protein
LIKDPVTGRYYILENNRLIYGSFGVIAFGIVILFLGAETYGEKELVK